MLTSTLIWLSIAALPAPQVPSIDSVAVREWREGQVAIAEQHAKSRSKDSTALERRLREVPGRRSQAWADVTGRDVLDSVRRSGDARGILNALEERRKVAEQSLSQARLEVDKWTASTKSWADILTSAQKRAEASARAESDCRRNATVGVRQGDVTTVCSRLRPSAAQRQADRESIQQATKSRNAAQRERDYAKARANELEAEVSELDQFIAAGRKSLGM